MLIKSLKIYLNKIGSTAWNYSEICGHIDYICSNSYIKQDGEIIKRTIAKLSEEYHEILWNIALYYECPCEDMTKKCCHQENEKRYILGFYYILTENKRFVDYYGNFYTTENAFLWNWSVEKCRLYKTPQNGVKEGNICITVNDEDFMTCLKEGFFQYFFTQGEDILNEFCKQFPNDFENKLKKLTVFYPFFQILLTVPVVSFQEGEPFQIVVNGNARDVGIIEKNEILKNIEDFVKDRSITHLCAYSQCCEKLLDELRAIKKLCNWMNETERSCFESKEVNSRTSKENEDNRATQHFLKKMKETFGNFQVFAYTCYKIAHTILVTEKQNRNQVCIDLARFKQLIYWIKYKCLLVYLNDKRAIVNNDINIDKYVNEFKRLLEEVQHFQYSNNSDSELENILLEIKNCKRYRHQNIDGLIRDISLYGICHHKVQNFEKLMKELDDCNSRNINGGKKRFLHNRRPIKNLINDLKKDKCKYPFKSNHAAAYHVNRHFDEIKTCYVAFEQKSLFLQQTDIETLLKDMINLSKTVQNEKMEPENDIRENKLLKECLRLYLKVIPDFIFSKCLYSSAGQNSEYYILNGNKRDTRVYIAGNHIFGVLHFDTQNALSIRKI